LGSAYCRCAVKQAEFRFDVQAKSSETADGVEVSASSEDIDLLLKP